MVSLHRSGKDPTAVLDATSHVNASLLTVVFGRCLNVSEVVDDCASVWHPLTCHLGELLCLRVVYKCDQKKIRFARCR